MPTLRSKERPIIFSGQMIRAILDERKMQTRRVVKPQPYCDVTPIGCKNMMRWEPKTGRRWSFHWYPDSGRRNPLIERAAEVCPYGQPGDRLWVRETLRHGYINNHPKPDLHYVADKCPVLHIPTTAKPMTRVTLPSIFMPRWASRIMLEITDVQVERVQEIGEDDIRAEGIKAPLVTVDHLTVEDPAYCWEEAFAELWDSINAKRGFGWDVNPWVWVVNFKKVDGRTVTA